MKRILVAYDGGDPARRALDTAADLARAFGAELSVVSVVPQRSGRFPTDPWDDRPVHDAELSQARDALIARGIHARLLEPAGNPAEQIERLAADGDYDDVVVGSRSLGAVGRVLAGSVSEHVAVHAKSTVIVAR
jgi:nucleotide-binding universal stress UspA family protein